MHICPFAVRMHTQTGDADQNHPISANRWRGCCGCDLRCAALARVRISLHGRRTGCECRLRCIRPFRAVGFDSFARRTVSDPDACVDIRGRGHYHCEHRQFFCCLLLSNQVLQSLSVCLLIVRVRQILPEWVSELSVCIRMIAKIWIINEMASTWVQSNFRNTVCASFFGFYQIAFHAPGKATVVTEAIW